MYLFNYYLELNNKRTNNSRRKYWRKKTYRVQSLVIENKCNRVISHVILQMKRGVLSFRCKIGFCILNSAYFVKINMENLSDRFSLLLPLQSWSISVNRQRYLFLEVSIEFSTTPNTSLARQGRINILVFSRISWFWEEGQYNRQMCWI